MMILVRLLACGACLFWAAGCSSPPSPRERATSAELAQLSPLKQRYAGIVMGFDVRNDATLLVSLDLQTFIGMDDDAATAMKRTVAQRWRGAWTSAHPATHAVLHVRFIDFVGRTVAEQSIRV